jgi:hypothetical protein
VRGHFFDYALAFDRAGANKKFAEAADAACFLIFACCALDFSCARHGRTRGPGFWPAFALWK